MKNTERQRVTAHRALASAGFTLVELMVGITVGLMVVMVAIYAIITARKASGTVTDISAMKQQASYVMYVMGAQIRQAGSMDAIQDPDLAMPTFYFSQNFVGLSGGTTINPVALYGTEGGSGASDILQIAIEGSPVLKATQTDCLGNAFPDTGDVLMTFARNASNDLTCTVRITGKSPDTQALAQNVTDFQVRYRYRQRVAGGDATTIADAGVLDALGAPGTTGSRWDSVNAVEVCIEMQGTEPVPVIAGATYTDCNETQSPQGNRLTRVYRSLYNVRVSV